MSGQGRQFNRTTLDLVVSLDYLTKIPRDAEIPAGRVVVHNHVRPTRTLGNRGFRAWLGYAGDAVPCDCGWAPELAVHYGAPARKRRRPHQTERA